MRWWYTYIEYFTMSYSANASVANNVVTFSVGTLNQGVLPTNANYVISSVELDDFGKDQSKLSAPITNGRFSVELDDTLEGEIFIYVWMDSTYVGKYSIQKYANVSVSVSPANYEGKMFKKEEMINLSATGGRITNAIWYDSTGKTVKQNNPGTNLEFVKTMSTVGTYVLKVVVVTEAGTK